MCTKLFVLTLGAVLCASGLAHGASNKELFGELNNWLVENVESEASPRLHVEKARDYLNQNRGKLTSEERKVWKLFADMLEVMEYKCTARSYILLMCIRKDAEVVNHDDPDSANRLHKVIDSIAKVHSQDCELECLKKLDEKKAECDSEMVRMAETIDELSFNRLMPPNTQMYPYTTGKISAYLNEIDSSPIEFIAGRVSQLLRMTHQASDSGEIERSVIDKFVPKLRQNCLKYMENFRAIVLPEHFPLSTFQDWTKKEALNAMRTVEFCKDFSTRDQGHMIDLIALFN